MGDVEFIDTMIKDGLTDVFFGYHMGITAENVAEKWQITRERAGRVRDRFAEQGRSRAEGRQVQGRDRAGHRQRPQGRYGRRQRRIHQSTARRWNPLRGLRPAFKKDGTVTAANASGINDGAAALVLMTEEEAKARGITPLARIASWASRGVDPGIMGTGPIPASKAALERAGWKAGDLDLIEANEAFAAQAIAVNNDMGWDSSKVNVNGGAIAIGHPIGASGARVLTTLLYEMQRRDAQEGPGHAVHRRRHGHRAVRRALRRNRTAQPLRRDGGPRLRHQLFRFGAGQHSDVDIRPEQGAGSIRREHLGAHLEQKLLPGLGQFEDPALLRRPEEHKRFPADVEPRPTRGQHFACFRKRQRSSANVGFRSHGADRIAQCNASLTFVHRSNERTPSCRRPASLRCMMQRVSLHFMGGR